MQVLKDRDDLRGIEEGLRDWETVDRAKVGEELAAADELEDHVEVAVVLGNAVEVYLKLGSHAGYDERVIDGCQYAALRDDVVHLLETDNLGFLEDFHGNVLFGVHVLRQTDTAEGAYR
ncbi:MAG: hypothetical protein P4L10_14730 [Acidobacteriaceae bacterium]|nr:hypothetical protein [Acidobacteriaceae bacterium]